MGVVQKRPMDRTQSTDQPKSLVAAIVLVTIWPFLNVGSALVAPLLVNHSGGRALVALLGGMVPAFASVLVLANSRRARRFDASRAVVLLIAVAEAASAVAVLWITSLRCWSPLCGN
jgi:hypothetical protein